MKAVLLAASASSIVTFSILLIAFLLRARIKRFVNRAAQTDGVVIALKQVSSQRRGTYAPVVRFITAGGESVEFTEMISSYPPKFKEKDPILVLYDPKEPRKARGVEKVSDLYFAVRILWMVGFGLLAAEVVIGGTFGLLFYFAGPFK